MINQNIFLIGMMGSGKSTIAPSLSKKINLKLIDLDEELLSILDTNISEISEEKFRYLESTFFLERVKKNYYVYATGGGIILLKENREAIKNTGKSFLLETSVNELFKRLQNSNLKNRPLLNNSNILDILNNLWEQRKNIYYDTADYIIKTDKKNAKSIVNEIIEILNEDC